MRNERIDFLRFLGLSLIILAHVNPSPLIAQLRNFDVPLMFFVMGMSFFVTEHKHTSSLKYIASRFKRLIIPTWIFFTVFYIISEIIWLMHGNSNLKYSMGTILATFALSTGIGYVWVIRIFFSVSVLAILIPKYFLKLTTLKLATYSLIFIIANTYLLSPIYEGLDSKVTALEIGTFISSSVVYLCVFLLGYKVLHEDRKIIIKIMTASALIFISLMLFLIIRNHIFISTQEDKYPPGVYYISFAIFMSLACYLLSGNLANKLKFIKLWPIALFISSNSIWIYLWHIVFIINTESIQINFLFRYLIVYSLSVVIVLLQVKLINKITSSLNDNRKSKFLHQVFTG